MKSHLLRLYHPRPRQFAYARMVREKGASPAAGGRPRLYATCTVVGIKLCDARHSRNSNCYDSQWRAVKDRSASTAWFIVARLLNHRAASICLQKATLYRRPNRLTRPTTRAQMEYNNAVAGRVAFVSGTSLRVII